MRNTDLKNKIKTVRPNANLIAAKVVPVPNTVNKQGHDAYALPSELRLISMLNTLKIEDQYYRTDTEQLKELRSLIAELGKKDPYFVAQCIVYSRCVGEKMRTVNHAAAVFLAPYLAGSTWGDRFYSIFNKKEGAGGCIYRPDDMYEIATAFKAYTKKNITNAMKRGFANALRSLDAYSLLKYKNELIDIINLARPNPNGAATVKYKGKYVPVFEALIKGYKGIAADTWEAANSEAGQIVAKAVRNGKVDDAEADKLLSEAKAANWNGLLKDKKLGILAALRNIRNILKDNPSQETVELLCKLLTNRDLILQGGIFPYQIDIAREVVLSEFGAKDTGRNVATALLVGYEASVPNFRKLFTGRTLICLDVSGSMNKLTKIGQAQYSRSSCLEKGALLAATIALGSNADIVRFGGRAEYVAYDPNENVFNLSRRLHANLGSTSLASALKLANGTKYDRVVIISDNEVNRDNTYQSYKEYIAKNGQPYVYSLDLASYGTTQILGDKVQTFFGYGFAMFDSMASTEFNPQEIIEKVRKIVI